jgi:hypothetical protein
MVAREVLVRRSRTLPSGQGGRGVQVLRFGTAAFERLVAEELLEGVRVGEVAEVSMSDVVVRGITGDGDVNSGAGLWLQRQSDVTVERASVDGAVYGGIVALQTRARLSDITVANVTPVTCTSPGCLANPGGHGLVSAIEANVQLARFGIGPVDLCGAFLAFDGQLDLTDGIISDSAIGACIQVDDYDVSRLSNRVTYMGNGATIETTELPVPEPRPDVVTMD